MIKSIILLKEFENTIIKEIRETLRETKILWIM